MNQSDLNQKPEYDKLLQTLTDYVLDTSIDSPLAYHTAHDCLFDSLGCALLALQFPECQKLLGPAVPMPKLKHGSRVPGTSYQLDPIQAAFNIGTQIRWLDFNDTWLAAEWGHPSDNLGALLALTDYLSQDPNSKETYRIYDLLTLLIKAYEIQGILALENSFNTRGLDHVILVKVASSAVAAFLLGADRNTMLATLSHAFLDGQALRTYRHAPNTGSRKSWAAGDATSRAVRLAYLVKHGEMGYPSVLTVPTWGFNAVYWDNKPLQCSQTLHSYVMENILFKISYPAEFHAQTAVEAAIQHYPTIKDRIDDISKIVLQTQNAAVRIISKEGPLHNPADRDHCLQYMVAIGLLYGELTAAHYEDTFANNPRIDILRNKMEVKELPEFSTNYLAPNKRAIGNAIQIFFKDGTQTENIRIDYPVGHKRRRMEGKPLLLEKFTRNISQLDQTQQSQLIEWYQNPDAFWQLPVTDLMSTLAVTA